MNTDNSAVSWGAIFAGAAGAASLSLVLFVLGTGLGLAAVSPWSHEGISAGAAGVSSIVWVTVVQLAASVLGGYLAGRLRSRWVTVHTHEVYFRDTAHGFLAWGVSTLLMATLLSSAVAGLVSGGAKAGAMAASAGSSYEVDSIVRGAPERAPEAARIFAHGLANGELDSGDTRYLGRIVAANAGVSQAEGEKRVEDTFAKAKQAADDARKKSAWLALWLVVSLFIGAFVASVSATFGGRLRDSSVLATA